MARKSQQPVPVQAALRGAYVAVSVGAFFLAVCLSSAATSKSAAMVLAAYYLDESRAEHDVYYIEHGSLVFDIEILLTTVFRGKFANSEAPS